LSEFYYNFKLLIFHGILEGLDKAVVKTVLVLNKHAYRFALFAALDDVDQGFEVCLVFIRLKN